jgi:hypothetical protein
MRNLWIIVFICIIINVNAQDKKKKKEKTPAEAISELKARLFEFEKYQAVEKYEREIATYSPSKEINSKMLLLAVQSEVTKYPKAAQRMGIVDKIVRIHKSFVDNKVPKVKRIAVANALRDKLIEEKALDEPTISRLSELLPVYLDPNRSLTHKDKDFPHLLQGASFIHATILASRGGGRQKALEIIEDGGSDRYAELVYKKLSKGHWTLSDDEKMEIFAFKQGMNDAQAKEFAIKKRASNKHCENYTGTTVTCEGQIFIKVDKSKDQTATSKIDLKATEAALLMVNSKEIN